MKVYTCIENLKNFPTMFMALGTFDGVHIGHQKLIRKAVAQAKTANAISAVFTFSNHPLSLIAPVRCPSLLMSNPDKIRYLKSLGVDLIFNVPFTWELLNQTSDEFIQLLTDNLNLRHVIVGSNFTYGFRGGGKSSDLQEAGEKHNFAVTICPLVNAGGIHVSSTRIRQLIAGGYVVEAAKLLNRPFALQGKIVKSNFKDRNFGFLRIGVAFPEQLIIPAGGIYAVNVKIGECSYHAVANIRDYVSFAGRQKRIELLLNCFDTDLYNQDIQVEFIERICNKRAKSGFQYSCICERSGCSYGN